MDIIPWYITPIRLLIPFIILRYPLLGIIASMLADGVDWQFIDVLTPADTVIYQSWDKMIDLYYWLFILWIVRSWKDIWAKRVAFGLFTYRLVGMIWFWISDWRPILFFFPNIFENFVVLSLIIFLINKGTKLGLNSLGKALMLTVVIVPKFINEYFQHLLGHQPWEIYDIGQTWGFSDPIKLSVSVITWGSLFYVIPILGFLAFYIKTETLKK